MLVATGVTEIRRAQQMPISTLATRAGVTRATIYAAERGQGVSLDTLVGIARALGIPLASICPEAAEAVLAVSA